MTPPPVGRSVTRTFAITFDYRCPYARIAHGPSETLVPSHEHNNIELKFYIKPQFEFRFQPEYECAEVPSDTTDDPHRREG